MKISLIIPTYNTKGTICDSIKIAQSFLDGHFKDYEIIIVDDGSTDGTSDEIDQLRNPKLRVIKLEENFGKGYAVSMGMAAALGDVHVFTDSDLPYDLRAILLAYHLIDERKFHLVVGDRSLPGSTYYNGLGKVRFITTRLFKNLVRLLITGEQFDTQCGFKAFRHDISKAIFPMITCRRFAFDVELLYIALRYNLEIRRIPVRYRPTNESSVSLLKDGFSMFLQILYIPFKARRGSYKNLYLEKLHLMNYWD